MRIARLVLMITVVLSATIVGGCKTLGDALNSSPKPTARIIGVGIRDLSLQSLDLVFDVEVTNYYGVALQLVDLSYAIGSGEAQLLQGGDKPSGEVPANGSKVMQLPARLDLANVIRTLTNIRPGSVVPYDARINVVVDTPILGLITLPLSYAGEFPIPAIPEISLASFDIASLTLDEVKASAKFTVKNTNQFPIDLTKLGLNLELGGKSVADIRALNSSKIAPGQTATVEIPLSFLPSAIGIAILNLLSGSDSGYGIAGKLDVGTPYGPLSLPFNQSGNTVIER